MKHLLTQLLIGALFSLTINQPVSAHAGVDHSKSCFLTVGDTRLQISGYQFQPELEGKHFCHFFPELGQTVLALEPVATAPEQTWATLELAELTSWSKPAEAFTVIKQQPAQLLSAMPVSISQTIVQRGIYRLSITLQDASGSRQQQFWFLAGVPVTKIMVMVGLGLVLVLAFAGVRDFVKKGSSTQAKK